MKRPLFAVAVLLVVIAALRLKLDIGMDRSIGEIFARIPSYSNIHVTGQVYRKDQDYLYIKSLHFHEKEKQVKESQESENKEPKGGILCEIPEGEDWSRSIALGSYVEVTGTFMPFRKATNDGEFDVSEYYCSLKLYGTIREVELHAISRQHWYVRESIAKMKYFLQDRIRDNISEKYGGILEALLLGDRDLLDPSVQRLYQKNGIFHILSISSLHITMIGMFLYNILRKLGVPIPVAGVGGCIILLWYGTLTGFGVSVIRAIGMYAVKILGLVVGRTYDMLTALGLLGGIMVTVHPYYLQNGGFLLSFTCVLGIGIVYPPLQAVYEKELHLHRGKAVILSLSIFITTLPLQLSLFYEVSVYSVVLNLLIIPMMQPLMMCGFLFLAFPRLGIFQYPIRWILECYEWLCRLFERLLGNQWCPGAPAIWCVVLYYLLLGLGVAILKYVGSWSWGLRKATRTQRTFLPLAGFTVCVVCAICLMGYGQGRAHNRVTFLDVGQGDCILVETAAGNHYLFDCGSSSRQKVGEYVLIPYLKYHGIKTLDGVFVSHPDADHTSGIRELFQLSEENGISIRQVVLPGVPAARGEAFEDLKYPQTRYISKGDTWQDDGAVFICLYPTKGLETPDANAYSQCFLVNFQDGWTLLLMGDLEGEGECVVAEGMSKKLQDHVVLKVAHHGSRGGTSAGFLEHATPDVAVISARRNNRYGHPHGELLERLENAESAIFSTAEIGQIVVEMKKGEMKVETYCHMFDY